MWLIICAFILIALFDLIPIIRDRSWAQMAAFITVFIPALTLALLLKLNFTVPSLLLLWGNLIKWLGLSY